MKLEQKDFRQILHLPGWFLGGLAGSFVLLFLLGLELLGGSAFVSAGLNNLYKQAGFALSSEWETDSLWHLGLIAFLVYPWAYLLKFLELAQNLIISTIAAILSLIGSPVLALWGVVWNPISIIIALMGSCLIGLFFHYRRKQIKAENFTKKENMKESEIPFDAALNPAKVVSKYSHNE